MFKIQSLKPTYSWNVVVKIPNNGSYDKFTVKVLYNRLPHDERMSLLEKIGDIAGSDNDIDNLKAYTAYEDELLEKVFAGWEKGQITDEDGEVEPDAAGIAKVLSITEFRKAVLDGYQQSVGGEAAKKGN